MKIKQLTFQYETQGRKIFDDFTWELDPQNVHFILGGNGVGKTTFYEIITGLLPYEGEIQDKVKPKDILLQLQGVPMLKTMTGKEFAELLLGADGEFQSINLETLKTSLSPASHQKLEYLWHSKYGVMSVGERRWLLIYLLSLLDRKLYIFDEPTAGLDQQAAKEILEIIASLSTERQKKVLLTTHQLKELNYFDQYTVSFFYEGKNYYTGSKADFEQIQATHTTDYPALRNFLLQS